MTTKTEKKAEPPKQIEKNTAKYSCQIILEKTTFEKAEIDLLKWTTNS